MPRTGYGRFINDKRDGQFIFKYPSGNISSIENYKEDAVIDQVFFFETGDTEMVAKNGFFRAYLKNKKIEAIQKTVLETKSIVGINFDTTGQLIYKYGSLDFLTKSDSIRLTKDYPALASV